MAGDFAAVAGGVRIVITGEGAQFSAVVAEAQKNLDKLAGKSVVAGAAMSAGMRQGSSAAGNMRIQIGLLDNAIRGQFTRSLADMIHGLSGTAVVMNLLPIAATAAGLVVLTEVVAKAAESFVNWREQQERAGQISARAWRQVEIPLRDTNDELQLTNDRLANSIAKMEGKPRNGLKEAIDEAIVAADKLGEHLDADLSKVSGALKEQQASWTSRWLNIFSSQYGTASTSDVTGRSTGLQDKLDAVDVSGNAQLQAMRKQGASEAQIHAEMEKLTQARQATIAAELLWATGELTEAKRLQEQREHHPVLTGSNFDESLRIRALTHYAAGLGDLSDFTAFSGSNYDLTTKKTKLDALAASRAAAPLPPSIYGHLRASTITPEQWAATAAWQESRAAGPPAMKVGPEGRTFGAYVDEEARKDQKAADSERSRAARESFQTAMAEIEANERAKEQWVRLAEETGTMGKNAAAVAMQTIHDQASGQYRGAFIGATIAGAQIPGSEAARYNSQFALQEAQDAVAVRATTAMGEFVDRLRAASEEFTSLGTVLADFTLTLLSGFNSTLVHVLSTPENLLRGRHPWQQLGSTVAQNAGGAALRFGEGEVMKGLFGRNPMSKLGTPGNPMYVKIADAAASNAGGLLSGLFGQSNAKTPSSPGGAAATSVISMALGLIPGFAAGGAIPANMPSIVGENGPELFMPSTSGRIAPNGSFGGALTIHIDARGANDPAATSAAVHRAMASYIPHLRNMAVSAIRDNNRRIPLSRGR